MTAPEAEESESRPAFKESISLVIGGKNGRILLVLRPLDEEDPYAGMWGLPAATKMPGESLLEAADRAAAKVGLKITPTAVVGDLYRETDGTAQIMTDVHAEVVGEAALHPSNGNGGTHYIRSKWGYAKELVPAAQAGSLCSRVLLNNMDVEYEANGNT